MTLNILKVYIVKNEVLKTLQTPEQISYIFWQNKNFHEQTTLEQHLNFPRHNFQTEPELDPELPKF